MREGPCSRASSNAFPRATASSTSAGLMSPRRVYFSFTIRPMYRPKHFLIVLMLRVITLFQPSTTTNGSVVFMPFCPSPRSSINIKWNGTVASLRSNQRPSAATASMQPVDGRASSVSGHGCRSWCYIFRVRPPQTPSPSSPLRPPSPPGQLQTPAEVAI